MVRFVARAQPLQDAHGLLDRRLVDRDLLKPASERAILLDVLELLVGRRSDETKLAGRQDGLDQRRQIHRPARGGARADGGVDLVDEEDRHLALAERGDDGLEAFLEVAAEPRAGEERSRIERKDLGAFEDLGDVVLQEPDGKPFGERRLADAGVADEHWIVLAPPAEDLERALQLRRPANERVEQAFTGAIGQVQRVRAERIARGTGPAVAKARIGVALRRLGVGSAVRRRDFADAVRDVFEDVEPRNALAREELRRVRLRLLQRRGEHVARLDFLPSGALDVQHRRLQHAPERHRLFGLFLLSARELFDVLVEVLVEIAPELRQIGAAGGEDALAVRIVRQRVQQVLERQVRVTPRRRLAIGDGQDHFQRWAKHVSG